MILPLVMPDGVNGGYNLAQMVSWTDDDINLTVRFADGRSLVFNGEARTKMIAELVFARNTYATFQAGVNAANSGPPLIQTPGGIN